MIISQLNSGLGNQMFQYAAGKSLSLFKKTDLSIDISWYNDISAMQTKRKYELSVFKIKENLIQTDAAFNYYNKTNPIFKRIINKIERNIPYYKRKLFNEQQFNFDPNFYKARKDVIISGYWQSEKYFVNISESIRTIFTCEDDAWGENDKKVLSLINSSESVSLHVRRGDMINNQDVAKVHGACDLNYYNNSIEFMNSSVKQPVYFIFSDDIEWAEKNIITNNKTIFVNHNKEDNAWLDMQLMSKCKHNIIANSSFSWWGAWLNKNKDKIVISPKRWFNHNNINIDDLIPSSWMKL